MMITGIDASRQVQGVYVYGNTHFNQAGDTAVSPVSRISSVARLDEDEEKLKAAVTYRQDTKSQIDDEAALREKENLAENYKNQDIVQYNMSNPYEVARMSIESSLLSGMNFDVMA